MQVIADLTIVPIGADISLSPYIAACERILRASELAVVLHANGTNVEGEWDAVFAALKSCHDEVHAMGAPRIFTIVKLGTRTDRAQHMEDKIRSVEEKLASA
jgi:uncharacterized protein (TIGR00106 family)